MVWRVGLILTAAVLLLGCSKPPSPTSTPATRPASKPVVLSEPQKVELLINAVRDLPNAVFIRNGQEYSGEAAAALMQYRWNRDKEQLKTAEQFIAKCATKSSTTGQPYLIRFKDGREIHSEEYLRRLLHDLGKMR